MTDTTAQSPRHLRPEAGALDWDKLTPEQQGAIRGARDACIEAAESAQSAKQRQSPSPDDETRHSHVLLFHGARGTGKSVALLSLRRWATGRMRGNGPAVLPSHIRVLAPLPIDLDALPPARSLLVQLAAVLYSWARAQNPDSRTRHESAALSWESHPDDLQNAWLRFVRAAVLGREIQLGERSQRIDAMAFALELEEAELEGLHVADAFRKLLDAIEQDQLRRHGGDQVLFLVSIDDADLAIDRSYELLQLTRLLYAPQLMFVLAGDPDILRAGLRQHFMWSGLPPHGRMSSLNSADRALTDPQVQRLATQAFRKCIPERQRFSVVPSRQSLETLWQSIVGSPIDELVPRDFAAALPETTRELDDLAHVAQLASVPNGERAAKVASTLWRWACEAEDLDRDAQRAIEEGRVNLEVHGARRIWLNSATRLSVPDLRALQLVSYEGNQKSPHTRRTTAAWLLHCLTAHESVRFPVTGILPVLVGGDEELPLAELPWPAPRTPQPTLRMLMLLPRTSQVAEEDFARSYVAAALGVEVPSGGWPGFEELVRDRVDEVIDLALWLLAAPEYGLSAATANRLFELFDKTGSLQSIAVMKQRRLGRVAMKLSPSNRQPNQAAEELLRQRDAGSHAYALVGLLSDDPDAPPPTQPSAERLIGALQSCRLQRTVRIASNGDPRLGDYIKGTFRHRLLATIDETVLLRLGAEISKYDTTDLDQLMLVQLWKAAADSRTDHGAGPGSWVLRSRLGKVELLEGVRNRAASASDELEVSGDALRVLISNSEAADFRLLKPKPTVVHETRAEPVEELLLRMVRDVLADTTSAAPEPRPPTPWPGASIHRSEPVQWKTPAWPAPSISKSRLMVGTPQSAH